MTVIGNLLIDTKNPALPISDLLKHADMAKPYRAWLVQIHDLGTANKADGNTEASLHAARVLSRLFVGHIQEIDTLQSLCHRLLKLFPCKARGRGNGGIQARFQTRTVE